MVDLNKAQERLAAKKQELQDLSDMASEARDPVALDQQSADIEEQLCTLGIETDEEKGTPKKGTNEKSTKNKRQRETESEKGDNRGSPDSQNSKKKRNKKRKTQRRGSKNN